MATSAVYNVEDEIAAFFTKTSVTRQTCDDRAKDLAGGTVTPIKIQGFCSYSVYAGPNLEYVLQFRPKSLELKTENTMLAKQLYGALAPEVSFVRQLGDDNIAGKEPLYIYLANRVRGVTQIEFNLMHACPNNSQETFAWRKTLIGDMARYTILLSNPLQLMDVSQRNRLRQTYTTELQLLLTALPVRFHTIMQSCIDSVDTILSLPMVLLHKDFGDCNIMVDETTCRLVGVIDWTEAEIGPFGLNLFALESLSRKLHLQNGWSRYEDYDILQDTFWNTFKKEVGGVTKEDLRTISLARTTGLLLTHGFPSRLANDPDHVPIGDDERERYNMLSLDGFLINLETRFEV
ncbi:hypothetical protein VE04_01385 [Pseudogymnoascus sp. 24MN13]|nr:hypothetical protein VE04_01385 [Pseudogymnoascus sp. 24MN13]